MNVKNNFFELTDFVIIEDFHVTSRIGTTAEERNHPQTLYLSIKLFTDLRAAGVSDNLSTTIDYAQVVADINDLLHHREFQLIEKAAEDIASLLLKNKKISAVSVRVGKKIFSDIGLVGAHIFRKR